MSGKKFATESSRAVVGATLAQINSRGVIKNVADGIFPTYLYSSSAINRVPLSPAILNIHAHAKPIPLLFVI